MAPAATATVKAIKRDIPFAWEGRDKRGARIKGKSLAPDEQTLRAKAGVERDQMPEAANEQQRSSHQHQRDRHLQHHQ